MQKNSERIELLKIIIPLFMTFIALATAFFVFVRVSFGWFASSTNVSGNGMSVQSQGTEHLQIRASAFGDDIGVSQIIKDMTSVQFPAGAEKGAYPGASGKFTFYVYSEGAQKSYSFNYRIIAENDEVYDGKDYPQGFYSGISDEDKERTLQYMSSHILFFENKTGNLFSGWINPEQYSLKIVDSAEAAAPCEVTVYWVWVANYKDIFKTPSALIEEQTRNEIQNYYQKGSNINKMMYNGENSANGFNVADTMIGISIKYMCFRIEVSR